MLEMPLNRLMTFADKLSILMSESPLSQTELGQMVGVHQTQISRWMRGEGSPSLVQAARMAEALKVSIDYLGRDEIEERGEASLSPEEALILKVVRRVGPVDVLESLIVGGIANAQASNPKGGPSGSSSRVARPIRSSATYRREESGPAAGSKDAAVEPSSGKPT